MSAVEDVETSTDLPAVPEERLPAEARDSQVLVTSGPTGMEFETLARMARAVASTKLVPLDYRNKPDEVLACFLRARELAIPPMYALQKIFITDKGKEGMEASLMVALIRRQGHRLRPIVMDDKRAVVWAQRRDTGDSATVEFTIEDARRAELAGKAVWKKYPQDLIWSRAVSRMTRVLFTDVVAGIVHTPEELQSIDVEGAFNEAVGKVTKGTAEPTSDTDQPGQGEEHPLGELLTQDQRNWLKSYCGASQGEPTTFKDFNRYVRAAFLKLGGWSPPDEEPDKMPPYAALRRRHAEFIRTLRDEEQKDPDQPENGQPKQTEIPT